MEEEEVDSWYEEEKQKVFNEYLDNIEKNKNKEEIEKRYKEQMKKTREKYMDLYEKSKQPTFSEKYFGWFKSLIDKLSNIKTNFIEKHSEKIKGFKDKIVKIISRER